jgi:hypothetical protein
MTGDQAGWPDRQPMGDQRKPDPRQVSALAARLIAMLDFKGLIMLTNAIAAVPAGQREILQAEIDFLFSEAP